MTERHELIEFERVAEDVLSAALGRKAPSRLRDGEALGFSVTRKPASASYVVVQDSKRWVFFGPRRMGATIRLASPDDAAWALAEFDRRSPPREKLARHSMLLWTPTSGLARGLVERGFELGSLVTIGVVSTALARLASRATDVRMSEAGSADARHIVELVETIRREGRIIPRGAALPVPAEVKEQLEFGARLSILARLDGRVVGTISAISHEWEGDELVGLEVLVHPDYRRKGVARAMYRRLLESIARRNDRALVHGFVAHPATHRLSAEMGRVPYWVHAYEGAQASSDIIDALALHETRGLGAQKTTTAPRRGFVVRAVGAKKRGGVLTETDVAAQPPEHETEPDTTR